MRRDIFLRVILFSKNQILQKNAGLASHGAALSSAAFSTTHRPSSSNITDFRGLTTTVTQEEQVKDQQKRNKAAGLLTELVRDFLDPADFYNAITRIGIDFFCGVPDSLLKDFCAYVTHTVPNENHVIACNEGSAIGLAAGHHLATGGYAMVYLQNSGLGNIVNPIMSLSAPSIYSIPMLLLVGWRGEPGKRDEPQHNVMGQVTPGLLAALGIPFQPLPDYIEGAEKALKTAKQYMATSRGPYCFLVKRQTFLPFELKKEPNGFSMTREQAVKIIVDNLGSKDAIVSTTGMLSRELFEYRDEKDFGHERDFLTVGSMGYCSSIAMGIALQKRRRQIICIDGDGAAIMHMGHIAVIGQSGPTNLKHIIINNGAHDSVGGQPTVAGNHDGFSFSKIAMASGYKEAMIAATEEELKDSVVKLRKTEGPVLLEVKVTMGGRKDLGRPTTSPQENKDDFMHFLAIK